MQHFFKHALACGAALLLAGHAGAGTISLIDTLPAPGAAGTAYDVYVSHQWHDVAVGFTAPGAGTITRIETGLSALPSAAPFFVGLASSALIGQPSGPGYLEKPASALAEFTVCSSVAGMNGASGCDAAGPWPAPDMRLGAGETLAFDTAIEIAAGGTYWLYTRFHGDETYASWATNVMASGLLATRTGICTAAPGACDIASHRTFMLDEGGAQALGLRVLFEAEAGGPAAGEVPLPATPALLGLGLAGLLAVRRRSTQGI